MMVQECLVSIIIPNFNRAFYLQEALESLCGQSYSNWECLIIDDASTDNSLEVAGSYQDLDTRFRLLKNRKGRKGAASARNWGVENARGKYIIFLDSDDLLASHCIAKRVEVMESQPALDFAVFPMLLFYKVPGDATLLWNIEKEEGDLMRFLNLDAVWQTSGPIWRKETLLKFPPFDESLSCWQDVGFHINVLLNKPLYQKFYEVPPDCYYRKDSTESISQQRINTPRHLHSRKLLIEQLQESLKNDKNHSVKTMYLSYFFSNLNAGRFSTLPKYLVTFMNEYKPGTKELIKVISLSFLKGLRLTKIVYLQELYSRETTKLLPGSSIGKHPYVF